MGWDPHSIIAVFLDKWGSTITLARRAYRKLCIASWWIAGIFKRKAVKIEHPSHLFSEIPSLDTHSSHLLVVDLSPCPWHSEAICEKDHGSVDLGVEKWKNPTESNHGIWQYYGKNTHFKSFKVMLPSAFFRWYKQFSMGSVRQEMPTENMQNGRIIGGVGSHLTIQPSHRHFWGLDPTVLKEVEVLRESLLTYPKLQNPLQIYILFGGYAICRCMPRIW